MIIFEQGTGILSDEAPTIADRIQQRFDTLTRAERQLAQSILDDYPVSGLGPLATLAENAGVSVPTVARMVQKLGYGGYPEFQAELREELKAKMKTPIARHDTWAGAAPSGHMLNRFTEAVIENIRTTLSDIDPERFDAAARMIADRDARIHIVGGRITHVLAEYLYLHMQVVRPAVTHIQTTSNTWPHYLLDVGEGDVFCIFDMRRYETNTLHLAQIAHDKGARIVLFTDQWRSPVHRLATITLSTRSVVPSAWDSSVATLLLVETLIAAVENADWDGTRERMETLEEFFDRTKLFRKFT
ncbi:MurR/RpiR family transcriptional regulator [Palleronia sp. LCG004]|uniref:MurR/RpiR family transcriptional regulator n=1 Tax=Palleronia sp. LCG004 TaxID=3079304 RepID=UPI002941FBE9|nr:MurR/RpiR family transcriptional regulator [Palleronia sp. LCG004]WOI56233.1 MurR/RpiR family transcriptional regulator [Palleronia sp. LCG004]